VPYPFAHPAAVLPLVQPLGRFAAPSALVIGSVVPDLWTFVPFVDRATSHSVAGLFWFCLPAGLAGYVLFHLVLKQPLIALLSPRLAAFTSAGLPPARWSAVAVSVFAGAITHLAWDALTHANDDIGSGAHNWSQHASTVLGSAILVGWLWRKLRSAPRGAFDPSLSPLARAVTITALAAATASAAWLAVSGVENPVDITALRQLLRTAASAAAAGLTLGLFVYSAIWQLGKKR
jgi:Domain of unknown function (DUF4184)